MLQMPRIPPATGFHFEGVQQYRLKQALAQEIRALLHDMRRQTITPGYQDMFLRFIDAIEPGEVRPFNKLPYATPGPNDMRGPTRIACVYARLSWMIQLFWDLCIDGKDNAALIRQYIEDMRRVSVYGIDRCRINGDERHGRWLEVPQ